MKLKKRLASIMLIASLLTGCSTGGNSSTKDGKETITVWAWDFAIFFFFISNVV